MGQIIPKFIVSMFASLFTKIEPIGFTTRTKMVFLVRTDLQMGKGKIASQVAHAAILLYKESLKNKNPYLNAWLRWGQPKIVLKVDKNCKENMETVYKSALKNNLTVCKVQDSGKTQIESGSLTVVGIGPNKIEDIDKITSQFKLL